MSVHVLNQGPKLAYNQFCKANNSESNLFYYVGTYSGDIMLLTTSNLEFKQNPENLILILDIALLPFRK